MSEPQQPLDLDLQGWRLRPVYQEWREKSADFRRTHARGVVAGVTAVEAHLSRTGKANADIADILRISVRTVHKHMERIFQKLGIDNRHAAIAIAMDVALRRA